MSVSNSSSDVVLLLLPLDGEDHYFPLFAKDGSGEISAVIRASISPKKSPQSPFAERGKLLLGALSLITTQLSRGRE
jgi:hypothetical protein